MARGSVGYPDLVPSLETLGQSRSERRISMPSTDAPTGSDDAITPYDIVNAAQLQKWADADAIRFLEAFNQLRTERDLGVELGERMEDVLAAQTRCEDNFTLEYNRRIKADAKILSLQKKLKEADITIREMREGNVPTAAFLDSSIVTSPPMSFWRT